jgi:hypothetical protein
MPGKTVKNPLLRLLTAALLIQALHGASAAAAPRETVSLNGIWDFFPEGGTARFDIRVPSFWDAPQDYGYPEEWLHLRHGVYKRRFQVPESFRDRELFLRIGRISVIAKVFVNGVQVGGETTGGYLMMQLPYLLDVTALVHDDSDNDLEIRIWGGGQGLYGVDSDSDLKGIHDFPSDCFEDGKLLYPWCVDHYDGRRGISGDVSLLAYPKTWISDVFVKPDLNRNSDPDDDLVSLQITVSNREMTEKTVVIRNAAVPRGGRGKKSFDEKVVRIGPDSVKTVEWNGVPWPRSKYWWPHDPQLYVLGTSLTEGGRELDRLDTRFGMRQFFVDGNRFRLNGVVCNLRGESFEFSWHEPMRHGPALETRFSTAETCIPVEKRLLREYAALNLNILRPHKASGIDELYEWCDETGMMVVDESAFWQTQQRTDARSGAHFQEWIRRWIVERRNHPSIVLWSVANESWHSPIPPLAYQAAKETDQTRPAYHQGVRLPDDFEGDSRVVHYTGGYPMGPFNTDSLYSVYRNSPDKPMGEGESVFAEGFPLKDPDGAWSSQVSGRASPDDAPDRFSTGEWTRGTARLIRAMRYAGLADSRSYMNWAYCFDPIEADIRPAWNDLSGPGIKPVVFHRPACNVFSKELPEITYGSGREYWRASCSPVAVFDARFDDGNRMGIEPSVYRTGQILNRELVVYNDELTNGTAVEIRWEAGSERPGSESRWKFASGKMTVEVPYGEKRTAGISFSIPSDASTSRWLVLRLSAFKKGKKKFQEDNRLGALISVPEPLLRVEPAVIQIGRMPEYAARQPHKIKLTNLGGGRSEKWTVSGTDETVTLNRTEGNLRGEEELYLTVRPEGIRSLKGNTSRTLTFKTQHGCTGTIRVELARDR